MLPEVPTPIVRWSRPLSHLERCVRGGRDPDVSLSLPDNAFLLPPPEAGGVFSCQ